MITSEDLISSGLLELYVLGDISEEDALIVEDMARVHEEIRYEIEQISLAMETYAMDHAVEPDPIVKPFLLATIDYMDRLQAGEVVVAPPLLNEHSTKADFEPWLNRKDMTAPDELENIYAKILNYTEAVITAIVWIRTLAPHETHDREYEKFLILEGTCNIIVEDEVYGLVPGNFFTIPLHKNHQVQVTSAVPCKVILQRVAA